MDYLKLKSGSDVRGNAMAFEGKEINLSEGAIADIVAAYAFWLKKSMDEPQRNLKIAVGHDSRLTGESFKNICVSTLRKFAIDVYDCGLASTPSMYMMTRQFETDCDGAIMITASHHPFYKNGMKFFTIDGGLSAEDITKVLEYANAKKTPKEGRGALIKKNFLATYCDYLIDFVMITLLADMPLKGLKIVVDAGNGAGGFYVDKILKALGADTSGSQFLNPDGNFPNHAPNPEDDKAMKSIRDCVIKNKADLGIIFDTDVDRAAVVTADGTEINKNRLIALVSSILLAESPGAYIVTDSVTSKGLNKFIVEKGGVHIRYKRGYNNVINKAKKLSKEGKNAVLAIETSGHAALRENEFLDDGAYLVTRLIIKLAQLKKEGKDLLSLIEGFEEPKETMEFRLGFHPQILDFKLYGESIINNLTKYVKANLEEDLPNFEGIRANVDYAKGWFLLRMSVHDPIMPLNIESDMIGGVEKIVKLLHGYLSSFSGLDCSPLKIYLE